MGIFDKYRKQANEIDRNFALNNPDKKGVAVWNEPIQKEVIEETIREGGNNAPSAPSFTPNTEHDFQRSLQDGSFWERDEPDFMSNVRDKNLQWQKDTSIDRHVEGFENFLKGSDISPNLVGMVQGVGDIVEKGITGKVSKPIPWLERESAQKAQAQQDFIDYVGNKDIANTLLQGNEMLQNFLVSKMLGGMIVPNADVGTVINTLLGVEGGLDTASQDIREGKDYGKSLVHGAGSGGISYLVEAAGGIGALPGGKQLTGYLAKQPAVKRGIDAFMKAGGKAIGDKAFTGLSTLAESAFDEGLEEGVEYPLQQLWESIVFGEKPTFDKEEWLSNIKVGAGVGGLFGIAPAIGAGLSAGQTETTTETSETADAENVKADNKVKQEVVEQILQEQGEEVFAEEISNTVVDAKPDDSLEESTAVEEPAPIEEDNIAKEPEIEKTKEAIEEVVEEISKPAPDNNVGTIEDVPESNVVNIEDAFKDQREEINKTFIDNYAKTLKGTAKEIFTDGYSPNTSAEAYTQTMQKVYNQGKKGEPFDFSDADAENVLRERAQLMYQAGKQEAPKKPKQEFEGRYKDMLASLSVSGEFTDGNRDYYTGIKGGKYTAWSEYYDDTVSGVPIYDANRSINIDERFDTREEAAQYMTELAYNNKLLKEEKDNERTLGEVRDSGAESKSDGNRKDDTRLLDEVSAEDERGPVQAREAVSADRAEGRQADGGSVRPNAERSTDELRNGSSERGDLQPSSRKVESSVKNKDKTPEKINPEIKKRASLEASRILKIYPSKISKNTLADSLGNLYQYMSNKANDSNSYDQAKARAEVIAEDVLSQVEAKTENAVGEYEGLKEYIKKAKFEISAQDASNIPDYNSWRKKHFGQFHIKKGKTNIDTIYRELHELYPSLFTSEHEHPADQLFHIADVMDQAYSETTYNPFKDNMEKEVNSLSDEILVNYYSSVGPIKPVAKTEQNNAAENTSTGKPDTSTEAENTSTVEESSEVEEPQTMEEEVKQKEELAVQEEPKGTNFVIPESGLSLPKGEKAKFTANVKAIKTLKKIMAEGRYATPEEQTILSKYVGWGGLSNAFNDANEEWAKEYKQLKKLLNEEEYSKAYKSTTTAFFTDPKIIRSIWNGIENFGFKGGRVLEPSAGVGNFEGAMPKKFDSKTGWTMVELDELTGNIAKYLYPNSDVRIEGFQKTELPDNYADLAIGNVPFAKVSIADKNYPAAVKSSIHNYFFAKSIDKVRPGGIIAFVTSSHTMDNKGQEVRKYIAERCNLLGAVRLPNTAFKADAGTSVVSDIVILQKRAPNEPLSGETFLNSEYKYDPEIDTGYSMNEYFRNHPEMILGKAKQSSDIHGETVTYDPLKGDLGKQIEAALKSIDAKMTYPEVFSVENVKVQVSEALKTHKVNNYVKKDGAIYQNTKAGLKKVELKPKLQKRISGMIDIRETAKALLNMQLEGESEEVIKAQREKLNTVYDNFVKEYGALNTVYNHSKFKSDPDIFFLSALEKSYNKLTHKVEKADIFFKNVITPLKKITHVDTIEEAITVVMNTDGNVDTAHMASLLGKTEEQVKSDLLESRMAYKDQYGNFQTAEQYLSGPVKAKLAIAEELAKTDDSYLANVEDLKKIIPKDISAEEISIQPGATWIPVSVYKAFMADVLIERDSNIGVGYQPLLGEYFIEYKGRTKTPENTSEWGTKDRSFVEIFTAMLNSRDLKVSHKGIDGRYYVDKQATAAIIEKREKILQRFREWIWEDESRKKTLVKLYNDVFNSNVVPKYDGSKLTIDGLNPVITPFAHQLNAVARILNSGGNTLLAHKVGAGKTLEMASAAMKLRQLGIIKKPVFVVPKSLVAQWGKEFLDYYPAAKILALGDNDFNAKNRKTFANRIATGDYDAVIMSYDQYKMIPMSAENVDKFYKEQIAELDQAMRLEGNAEKKSVKDMATAKNRLEAQLDKKLGEIAKDENNISFEEMGIDSIFVDEAHNYKNLMYTTQMNNVKGLGTKEGSERALDMFMKVRYLQQLNGGKGIVFATATPVMNSMSEMYIMQKYLQPNELQAKGITSFDSWAKQFGEVRTILEINPSGTGYRQVQSFSRFKNLAELQQMFRSFADVVTELPYLKIPKLKDGKRTVIECEMGPAQKKMMDELVKRSEAVKQGSVDPKEDNMLKITTDGRKVAYTAKMIDSSLPYEENGKINRAANEIFKRYKEYDQYKATQLVFCDMATPKGGSNIEDTKTEAEAEETVEEESKDSIRLYQDLKQMLMLRGIPANEIAFIHDAKTNAQKTKLFEDVNNGTVRVLIGSTGKMGVGMNVQKRLIAEHHLDPPWRPGDYDQREGRMLRQKNMFADLGIEVESIAYVTKGSFDARMWDNLQRKSVFINQTLSGDITARESEGDGDFALSAAEIKAIASGDPRILKQFEIQAEITRLENLEKAHRTEVAEAIKGAKEARAAIQRATLHIKNLTADIAKLIPTAGDNFKMVIGNKPFTERKAAGEELIKLIRENFNDKLTVEAKTKTIGNFAGLTLEINNKGEAFLSGEGRYSATVNLQSPIGTIQSFEAIPKTMRNNLASAENVLKVSTENIPKYKAVAAKPFEKAAELSDLRKENDEILSQLTPDEGAASKIVEEEESTTHASRDITTEGTDDKERWTAERVGEEDKVPARLSEIFGQVAHDFNINITTGQVRGKDVSGTYNDDTKGIRVKKAYNLPTLCHELGHHFDNIYGLSELLDKETLKELTDGLSKAMKEKNKQKDWKHEGIAEYLRKFMQNSTKAAVEYPLFTDLLKRNISGKDLALLEHYADEINAYYAEGGKTATSTIHRLDEKAPDYRTRDEKFKEAYDNFYQKMVNNLHGIKLFDDAMGSKNFILASNAAYADAMAGNMIKGGDLTDKNGAYVGEGLKTVLEGINVLDEEEYAAFGEYLIVKHGPERFKEGQQVFEDPRLNNEEFMKQRQAELEEMYPQFAPASERFYEYIKLATETWQVDTGLLSQQTFNDWGKRWEYYVPFNRFFEEKSSHNLKGTAKSFANQSNIFKRAHGSAREFIHPVDAFMYNLSKMVHSGVYTNVAQHITETAERMGADATWLEKLPPQKVPKSMNIAGVKEQVLESMKENKAFSESAFDAAEEIFSGIDDVLTQYVNGNAHGNIIIVMKDGKPQYWKVNDKLLLESMTSLSNSSMDGILDTYAIFSRFMTANITGRNLVWSLFSNLPRDLQTFFIYSKNKNVKDVFKSMGEAYLNAYNEHKGKAVSPLYKEYLAMGGGHTSAYTSDRNLAKKAQEEMFGKPKAKSQAENIFNKTLGNIVDWIGFVSDMIEAGPRYATYKMMRDAGKTTHEAFYEAMDVTVNFRAGSKTSRQLNKVVPFYNASVQGLDKFARFITAQDVPASERKAAAKHRFMMFVSVSAAMAAMFYALNNSDDEDKENYQQLSTYTKNSYWCIPIGGGKYWCLSKPRELAVLSSFIETTLERFVGKNKHAYDGFYEYFASNCLPSFWSDIAQFPVNGMKETIAGMLGSLGLIGVGAYIVADRDFLGRPIVNPGVAHLEPKKQYNDRTSKIAYYLGQVFGGSPQQIDFFFQQILGGFWKVQRALFPMNPKERDLTLGIYNTYVKDNQYSTDLINWLYDERDQSAAAHNSNPDDIDKAVKARLDDSMAKFYSNYNRLARNVERSEASRGTRQIVFDVIKEYQKAVDNGDITNPKNPVYKVCKGMGETNCYPSVMPTEVKDGSGRGLGLDKHKLSDIQYVEYQLNYNRLYYEYLQNNLPDTQSIEKRAAVVEKAKQIAKEEATNQVLRNIGAPQTKFSKKYRNVPRKSIVEYEAREKLETDGTPKQSEVETILDGMGLAPETYAILWQAATGSKSKKNNPYGEYLPDDYFN